MTMTAAAQGVGARNFSGAGGRRRNPRCIERARRRAAQAPHEPLADSRSQLGLTLGSASGQKKEKSTKTKTDIETEGFSACLPLALSGINSECSADGCQWKQEPNVINWTSAQLHFRAAIAAEVTLPRRVAEPGPQQACLPTSPAIVMGDKLRRRQKALTARKKKKKYGLRCCSRWMMNSES